MPKGQYKRKPSKKQMAERTAKRLATIASNKQSKLVSMPSKPEDLTRIETLVAEVDELRDKQETKDAQIIKYCNLSIDTQKELNQANQDKSEILFELEQVKKKTNNLTDDKQTLIDVLTTEFGYHSLRAAELKRTLATFDVEVK